MGRKVSAFIFGLGFFTATLAPALQAYATLGESADSIERDRKAFSVVRSVATVRKNYTVHEIQADSNFVREYVSAAGVVFGIAWNGRTYPDLSVLLGSYSGEYHESFRQTKRNPGRRYLKVKTNRLVVEKWGHMRNLQGRAYDPTLVPAGVGIDEIR